MKKIDKRIPIIIILLVILITMCYFYFKKDNTIPFNDFNKEFDNIKTTKTILETTSEVKSALTEKIQLHATYYLEEIYVSENKLVKQGENILKYTNGTYLTAPYDLIVTSINTPNILEQANNNHSIGISSVNALKVELNISESLINKIEIGTLATIKIPALDNKIYEGVVTSISNIASNKRFSVTVEFENDGMIYLGMSATINI